MELSFYSFSERPPNPTNIISLPELTEITLQASESHYVILLKNENIQNVLTYLDVVKK